MSIQLAEATAQDATTDATTTAQAQVAEQPKQDPPKAEAETAEQTIARLTRELADTRAETGRQRVTAKTKAADEREETIIKKLMAALGREEDGSKTVSSDELALELKAEKAKARNLELRENVRSQAPADVDASRLLKFTDFLDAVKDVDPSDAAAIKKAVTDTVAANPWLKTALAAGKGGTEMSGGTGDGAITKEAFAQMTGAQRNQLFRSNPALYNRLAGNPEG